MIKSLRLYLTSVKYIVAVTSHKKNKGEGVPTPLSASARSDSRLRIAGFERCDLS